MPRLWFVCKCVNNYTLIFPICTQDNVWRIRSWVERAGGRTSSKMCECVLFTESANFNIGLYRHTSPNFTVCPVRHFCYCIRINNPSCSSSSGVFFFFFQVCASHMMEMSSTCPPARCEFFRQRPAPFTHRFYHDIRWHGWSLFNNLLIQTFAFPQGNVSIHLGLWRER